MAARAYKQIALGTFLLGTTALVAPAAAQTFDNQVNATALISTNTGNVLGIAAFGQPQLIQSGIGNNIGASATGALGVAGVNQTVSQSTVQQGLNTQGGNSVVVQDISATNNTTAPIVPSAQAPAGTQTSHVEAIVDGGIFLIGTVANAAPLSAATGGGISNSIGASATGASAVANIVQSFDTNTAIDLTQLATNLVKTGTLTATNTAGSVEARLNPTQQALIADGISNSITAQATGASAGAAISSRMLDTANTFPNANPIVGVATNTVKTGDISATNRDTVTATYALGNPLTSQFSPDTATILNGSGNTIGAIASGASASASVNQSVDYTTLVTGIPGTGPAILANVYGNSVNTGSLTAFNSKDGVVTATLGVPVQQPGPVPFPPNPIAGATISNGVGNTIAAQASGASASGSIDQRYANVNASFGGFTGPFAATNNLTTGTMSAVNRGDVSAYGAAFSGLNISPTASLISAGIGNTIGASAIGASTGLSITQAISGSTIIGATPVDNTAKLNADGGMTARNGKNAAILAIFGESGNTLISNGAGNTIGATAIGASSGATVNQSVLGTLTDVASLGSNTVIVKDTSTTGNAIVARNAGSVTAIFQPNLNTSTTTISDGVANSISAQAVGATVNASVTSRFDNTNTGGPNLNATLPVNKIDTTNGTTTNLLARNTGAVTATFGPLPLAVAGDLQIVTGVANHIGASAAGAAASAGVNQSVSFESLFGQNVPTNLQVATADLFNNTVKTGDITAKNLGNVTSTLYSPGNVTIGTAPFLGPGVAGVGNSISAQSVGASASASITSQFYNVVSMSGQAATPAGNKVVTGDLTAINNPAVTNGPPPTGIVATATIGTLGPNPSPANASIFNGVSNFIGATAVGASAGASITQSVSAAAQGVSFDNTLLPVNSVTTGAVTATNAAPVTATLTVTNGISQIGPAGAPVSFSAGNVGNSIAAQAVGASASASITTAVFNTSIPQSTTLPIALATNTVKVASLSSSNSGAVQASASFGNGNFTGPVVSINGGTGNVIGASATGASSVASINQVVSTSTTGTNPATGSISSLNTLAANTINVGSITANNSGNITATLSTIGQGSLIGGIAGGAGNSISANAVGAMAGVSITQSIANSR